MRRTGLQPPSPAQTSRPPQSPSSACTRVPMRTLTMGSAGGPREAAAAVATAAGRRGRRRQAPAASPKRAADCGPATAAAQWCDAGRASMPRASKAPLQARKLRRLVPELCWLGKAPRVACEAIGESRSALQATRAELCPPLRPLPAPVPACRHCAACAACLQLNVYDDEKHNHRVLASSVWGTVQERIPSRSALQAGRQQQAPAGGLAGPARAAKRPQQRCSAVCRPDCLAVFTPIPQKTAHLRSGRGKARLEVSSTGGAWAAGRGGAARRQRRRLRDGAVRLP